jgi:hypothetical protein
VGGDLVSIHAVAWTCYLSALASVARHAWRDFRDPAEDREVLTLTAGAFVVLFAAAGILIADWGT